MKKKVKKALSGLLVMALCIIGLGIPSAGMTNPIIIKDNQKVMRQTDILTYYVAITGNDRNKGTIEEPFRNIQKAATIMAPGDTCIIREGVYRETVVPHNNGTVDL